MSTDTTVRTKPRPSEEVLREIVINNRRYRRRAALQLMGIGPKERRSLVSIIQYVPALRRQAISKLLTLLQILTTQTSNVVGAADFAAIYESTASLEIIEKTSLLILANQSRAANRMLFLVIEYDERYREAALSRLMKDGPRDVRELNAIWAHADPNHYVQQWQKYLDDKRCKGARPSHHLVEIIEQGIDDLPELAMSALEEYEDFNQVQDLDKLTPLLDLPEFRDRALELIWPIGIGNWSRLADLMERYPFMEAQLWATSMNELQRDGALGRDLGLSMMVGPDNRRPVRNRAARELLMSSQKELSLACMLDLPAYSNTAAALLLEGDFEPDEA
jgi:hypothetical protein